MGISRRNWKERYFELHSKFGQSILSWSVQKGGKIKGFLNLVGCSVSSNDDERKHMKGFIFEISHATRRNLSMCAESEAERSAWIKALQSGIDCANVEQTSNNSKRADSEVGANEAEEGDDSDDDPALAIRRSQDLSVSEWVG